MRRITKSDVAVLAVLLAYALGFALNPPRSLLIVDESRYVSQAVAFARGHVTLPEARVVVPEESGLASDYPPGTSLLQTPLVYLGGWRAAAWLSVLALVAATLLTRRWLKESGNAEAFALMIPAYLGALFFGRVAMSDMPSAAIVALSLWLLWRADTGDRATLFLAGLASGASLLFRETNALLLAPFVVGALMRFRARAWPLVAGGVLSIAVRLAISQAMFGDALYVRDPEYGFSAASLAHNLLPYSIILFALFPAAAVLPFLYRGQKRVELTVALLSFFALFLFYGWDSIRQNGLLKGIVLDTRFILPALPLLAFALADVQRRRAPALTLGQRTGAVLVAGLALAAFGIHFAVRRLEMEPVAVTRILQTHTSASAPVVTNHDATFKYFSPAYGDRRLILRSRTRADEVPGLLQRFGKLDVALLDRTDSELFARDAADNGAFVASLATVCRLTPRLDTVPGNFLRLRVWQVTGCR